MKNIGIQYTGMDFIANIGNGKLESSNKKPDKSKRVIGLKINLSGLLLCLTIY